MHNAKDMYGLALAEAIKQGPVTIFVNGRKTVTFALSRASLEDLYEENHFSLDRSTWTRHIRRWEKWGAVCTGDLDSPISKWYVMFGAIDQMNHTHLKMVAEDSGVEEIYPRLAEGASIA